MSDPITTVKIPSVRSMNEKEYAQFKYDEALKKMLENPTKENLEAFGKANAHLYEVEDAYRIALRLLSERARNLANAVFWLNRS